MIKNRFGFFDGSYVAENGNIYIITGSYDPVPHRFGESFDPQNQLLWVRFWIHGQENPTSTYEAFLRFENDWEIGNHGAFFGFKAHKTHFLNWLKEVTVKAISNNSNKDSVFIDKLDQKKSLANVK
jgi:hypothetical protein